jgi:hypothetical protein
MGTSAFEPQYRQNPVQKTAPSSRPSGSSTTNLKNCRHISPSSSGRLSAAACCSVPTITFFFLSGPTGAPTPAPAFLTGTPYSGGLQALAAPPLHSALYLALMIEGHLERRGLYFARRISIATVASPPSAFLPPYSPATPRLITIRGTRSRSESTVTSVRITTESFATCPACLVQPNPIDEGNASCPDCGIQSLQSRSNDHGDSEHRLAWRTMNYMGRKMYCATRFPLGETNSRRRWRPQRNPGSLLCY